MLDLISDLDRWREAGDAIALATVIATWGSAPRRVGAKMALTPDGQITGSVSGGCVEGAVFEAGVQVLDTKTPQLLHFGVADETAWEVGLACGGNIDVFVQPLRADLYDQIRHSLSIEKPHAIVTIIQGPAGLLGRSLIYYPDGERVGSIDPALDRRVVAAAEHALEEGESQRVNLDASSELVDAGPKLEAFIEVNVPPPTLIMVGGVHIAIGLATIAKAVGYQTVVIDPRRAFGSEERFSHVDRLIQSWPEAAFQEIRLTHSTAVAMLTHDPKIDDPALRIVLPSPAFYIGALGSRTTQERRRNRMREAGFSEALVDRIQGPIGLPIGAQSPEEIALAIMAQIVAARNQHLTPEGRLK